MTKNKTKGQYIGICLKENAFSGYYYCYGYNISFVCEA